MNNRLGKEWQFNVTTDRKLIPDHNSIQVSVANFDTGLAYISHDLKRGYDCSVTIQSLTITCLIIDNENTVESFELPNMTEPLFFGPNFFHDTSDKIAIITVIDKKNRSRRTLLMYENMRFRTDQKVAFLYAR